MNAIRKFLKEEDGVTALEYGLLAALVAGILVIAFQTPLRTLFNNIFTALGTIVSNATPSG